MLRKVFVLVLKKSRLHH